MHYTIARYIVNVNKRAYNYKNVWTYVRNRDIIS